MNYYTEYGKVTLSKGAVLYHSSTKILNELSDNLFLCLDNSSWHDAGKTLNAYKLVNDIDLILTIQNDSIINKHTYSTSYKRHDYEVLTSMYNTVFGNIYKGDDVDLKKDKTQFPIFCNKLNGSGYKGVFNYIDSDNGIFEIVIFKPNEYLKKKTARNNLKPHTIADYKRLYMSKKVNYMYPYQYTYEDINRRITGHPSIFWYIYKKTSSHN